MKTGICSKCGNVGNIDMHHVVGYTGDTKDFVLPYCHSCHTKAHIKARTSGVCNIPSKELHRLSHNSVNRRTRVTIDISKDTISPNIRLVECIIYNTNTKIPSCATYFSASNGKKLYEVWI